MFQHSRRAGKLGRRFRRGSVITPGVFFGGVVGLGLAALAVDTGLMFSAKQELRNAADAAALAAASQLGTPYGTTRAAEEAARVASRNRITQQNAELLDSDIVFGYARWNGSRYDFEPNQLPYNAVQVTLRRDVSVTDGPVSLMFGKALGVESADVAASAVAMVVPRDISVVVDLSSNMNDDSELQHHKNYQSQYGTSHGGVQVGTEDVWVRLSKEKGNNGVGNGIDPPPPGNPSNLNDQPGTGPGSPASKGGNPNPGANPTGGSSNQSGPRFGWMTGYGDALTLDTYDATIDAGLYYIPKGQNTSHEDVLTNLEEAGYAPPERAALKNGSSDATGNNYRNRVKVMLGLAGWRSGKNHAKYTGGGNGDNNVDDDELLQPAPYNLGGGSWDSYIDYVASGTSRMAQTDSSLQYRFGIKTVVNYVLEQQAGQGGVPELANVPEMPLGAVKNAVQQIVNRIIEQGFNDHVSLETFSRDGHHEVDLTVPVGGQNLAELLGEIPATLNARQAGHYDRYANMGAGIEQAIAELTGPRARGNAAKLAILMTNGRPNVDGTGTFVGEDNAAARDYALEKAGEAKDLGITVYAIGVGDAVDADFLRDVASSPSFYYETSGEADPTNHGLPNYVDQLATILADMGDSVRPVKLIE